MATTATTIQYEWGGSGFLSTKKELLSPREGLERPIREECFSEF
jgi:hypothetical protein